MVVISLQSIFDLIKESQTSHPELCIKVLNALLGVLQNLLPESLKNEPPHVVGKCVAMFYHFFFFNLIYKLPNLFSYFYSL